MNDQSCQYGVNCPNTPVFNVQVAAYLANTRKTEVSSIRLCQPCIDKFKPSDHIKIVSKEEIND